MASKSNAAIARESRRRKILEGGADRLAIITGGIHSLPAQSSGGDGKPSDGSSNLRPDFNEIPPRLLSDVSTADEAAPKPSNSLPKQAEESMLPLHESTGSVNVLDGSIGSTLPDEAAAATGTSAGHLVSNLERSVLDEIRGTVKQSGSVRSAQSPAVVESSSGTEQLIRGQTRQRRFVTASQISSAITASERTRIFCSVAIAILVASSHIGFPLLGNSIVKGILSFRPLYLLLLTNATVVIARVLLNNQWSSEMVEMSSPSPSPSGASDWAAQASKALEISLMAKKAVDAILMDASVYAIIVVCAFCVLGF
ncbi:hypothetical protein LINGRAHAP2_LOCUS24583 [Linum grandiflorum]